MRMKNKLIVLLCWLFLGGLTYVYAGDSDVKNALVQRLETQEHDTLRLQTLCELIDICKPEPLLRKQYTDELLKEAELQNDNLYKCRAYLYQIYMCFNANDRDSLQKWLDLLVPLAQKEKYYDLMFLGKQCAIDLLVLNEAFEELGNKAEDMLREAQALKNKKGVVLAYQSIARAYCVTDRLEQAADMLEKACATSLEFNDYVFFADINNSLIATYKELKNYPGFLKAIQLREEMLLKEVSKRPEQKLKLKIDFFYLYISYAEYYLAIKDLQNAKKCIRLTDEYYSGEYFINKLRYYEVNKSYFVATNQWDKALVSVDSLIAGYLKVEYSYYNNALLNKADIFLNMDEYEQAIPLYEKALEANDSILVSIYNKQVDFIKNAHATEKMQLQTLSFRYYINLSVLVLIAVIIVVLLIFSIFKYRINRELRRSEKKMRLITQEVVKINKVKESFISNMNNAIREPLTEVVNCSLALASDKEFTKEEKDEASGVISKTATELSQLINDILDLSRLEAGMMKFQVADIFFHTYLEEALAAASTNHTLQVNNQLEQGVNYQVRYDGNWLFRLMRSVFVPMEGGNALTVSIEVDKEQGKIVVTTYHSILLTPNPNQSIVIQSEMNRMLVEYFGGSWEVVDQEYVKFTIPLIP